MGLMKEMEIVWDEIIDAFENTDPDVIYLFDRESGEIFPVPLDYGDEEFWDDLERNADQYLRIPPFVYEDERQFIHDFIKGVDNHDLRHLLERSFVGKRPFGRFEEILSFYPEEQQRLSDLRSSFLLKRIHVWLEEHDIYPAGEEF